MLKVKLICLLGLLGLSYQGLTLAESTLNFKETLQPTVRKPAEWEAQEAVWLIWPNFNFLKSKPVVNVHLQIIKSLANHVKVNLIVQNQREIELAKHALTKRHIAYDHVNFKIIPHFDIWIRDFGAIFVKTADNQLNVVDLNFNVWGYETPTSDIGKLNESIDRTIAQQLKLPTLKTSMIMEGGGLEFNGSGTVITTESVIFDRNPLMSKSEVESEFNRLFGAKNVIWLKKGLAEDDRTNRGTLPGGIFTMITTNGHSDEFVRFVGKNKLLMVQIPAQERKDPIAKITGERMDENWAILNHSTDENGHKFKIIPMPAPEALYEMMGSGDSTYDYISQLKFEDGTTFVPGQKVKGIMAASYMNYLVTNDVVLLPKYWKPGRSLKIKLKDEQARLALQQAFPERQIIQIDPENVNVGGGGMHCITHDQPK